MAKHKYLPGGSVLFDSDESDIEDNGSPQFRSRIPRILPKETGKSDLTQLEQKQITLQKIQAIEKKTLGSAQRSINMLRETNGVGISAAKELVSQGEKLQNANMKLDEINSNLKESQKHINGIKSVFFGIKNYISGNSRSPSPHRRHISPHKQSPKLGNSRFYDTTDSSHKTMKGRTESPARSLQNVDVQSAGPSGQQVDDLLEANLQEMAYHLTHLKELGVEFGKEIDHQNELIETLQDKIDRADIKIGKQNKDMKNILGK